MAHGQKGRSLELQGKVKAVSDFTTKISSIQISFSETNTDTFFQSIELLCKAGVQCEIISEHHVELSTNYHNPAILSSIYLSISLPAGLEPKVVAREAGIPREEVSSPSPETHHSLTHLGGRLELPHDPVLTILDCG